MERIPKLINFPVDLVFRIDEYRKKNNIKSFSGTVYQLIRKGLEKSTTPAEAGGLKE